MKQEDLQVDTFYTKEGYAIRLTHMPTGKTVIAHYPVDKKSLLNELEAKVKHGT